MQTLTDGKIAPEIDWNKLRAELTAYVRRRAPDLDVQDIVGTTIEKALIFDKKAPVTNFAGLAHEIAGKEVANAIRKAERQRHAFGSAHGSDDGAQDDIWSALQSAIVPGDPGGRPRAQRYETDAELRAAATEQITAEFRTTWKAEPGGVLPGRLLEMNDQQPRDRRAWLAWALDHALGDFAPWAVDPGCRVRGAFRRADAVGVPNATGIPNMRKWKAERNPGRRALELLADQERMAELLAQSGSLAELEAAFWEAAGGTPADEPPPLGDEFLTDREVAIVSLLLGNWPSALSKRIADGGGATVGDVVSAEIEAIQYARAKHGLLGSPREKREAGVGPTARRDRPPEKT